MTEDSLLRTNRRYRQYLGAQSLSMLGDAIGLVALPFALIEAGYGAGALAVIMTCVTGGRFGAALVAGALADRVRRDRLMAVSDLVRALTQVGAYVLLAFDYHSLGALLALYTVFGVAAALFPPAAQGVIAQVTVPAERQRANAYLAIVDTLSSTAAPALAGMALTLVAAELGVLADAVSFMLSGLLVLRLRLPPRAPAEQASARSLAREIRDGLRVVGRTGWLCDGIIFSAAVSALGFAPFLALTAVVTSTEDGGSLWGVLLGCYGGGALAGSVLAVRLRFRRPLAVSFTINAIGWVAALLALALAPHSGWLLAAPIVAAGIGHALRSVIWDTTLQTAVPDESLGRVASVDFLVNSSWIPISYAAVGLGAHLFGASTTLTIAAVLVVVVAAVLLARGEVWRKAIDLKLPPADRHPTSRVQEATGNHR